MGSELLHLGAAVLAASVASGSSRWYDSVDALPTFEYHFMVHGTYRHRSAERILKPLVERRILPFVRLQFNCPEAVVCTALFRRYLPGERRIHPAHFDREAFITVVLSLNAAEYVGGLYVQGVSQERWLVPLEAGDAIVHQFDL